jgi:transcriptional regulator with XRE-family HTH domain
MGFGVQLRSARIAAGLSQEELADKAGISVDSIQNWEQGRTRPRLTALGNLALALGVSLDTLILAGKNGPEGKQPRGRPRKEDAGQTEPARKGKKRKEE